MKTVHVLVLSLFSFLFVGCQSDPSDLPPEGPCTESLDIRAYAEETATSSGIRVFGEVRAEGGTTVRSVLVAGQQAPLSAFNYRGFQVDLSQDVLEAVAEGGVATISVVAYTSAGCAELPEDARPTVKVLSEEGSGGEGGAS